MSGVAGDAGISSSLESEEEVSQELSQQYDGQQSFSVSPQSHADSPANNYLSFSSGTDEQESPRKPSSQAILQTVCLQKYYRTQALEVSKYVFDTPEARISHILFSLHTLLVRLMYISGTLHGDLANIRPKVEGNWDEQVAYKRAERVRTRYKIGRMGQFMR